MADDSHHHDGPTAAMRPYGLGLESDIYSRSILDRLSTGTRTPPQTSSRTQRARTAEPSMSGYYHHPGDDLYDESHSGPPLYIHDIDPALEGTSGASYASMYPSSTQGPPAAPYVTPPSDTFGSFFVPYDDPHHYPLEPPGAFPGSENYPYAPVAPPPNFAVPIPHDPVSTIGGSASSTAYPTPVTGAIRTPYLSPNPASPRGSSRSESPGSHATVDEYGVLQPGGTWTCAYPGCRSTVAFTRPCDLRKHYHRHEKRYFCRHDGCERSEAGARRALEESTSQEAPSGGQGYGTRKDRDRHERTHNPSIPCPIEGCHRRFARADNMRDHYKRIHLKGSRRR